MTYFAVIDTETTFSNEVMSIGVVIANSEAMEPIAANYYLIDPYYKMPSMYTNSLYIVEKSNTFIAPRVNVISSIKALLSKYNTRTIMAYNASFDRNHLPELQSYDWYDIMKIAAYRQYNRFLPYNADYCSSGRLKSGYTVNDIMRYLNPNYDYLESHNAFYDAIDELKIVKLLKVEVSQYEVAKIGAASSTPQKITHLVTAQCKSECTDQSKEKARPNSIQKAAYVKHDDLCGENYSEKLYEQQVKGKDITEKARDYAQMLADEYTTSEDELYKTTEIFKKMVALYSSFPSDEIVAAAYSACLSWVAFNQKSLNGCQRTCNTILKLHNQFPQNQEIAVNFAESLSCLCNFLNLSECKKVKDNVYSLYRTLGNNKDIKESLSSIIEEIQEKEILLDENYAEKLYEWNVKGKDVTEKVRNYAQMLSDEYLSSEDGSGKVSETLHKMVKLYDYFSFDEIVAVAYSDCLSLLVISQDSLISCKKTCNTLLKLHNHFPKNQEIVVNYAESLSRLCEFMNLSECKKVWDYVSSLPRSFENDEGIKEALSTIEDRESFILEQNQAQEVYLAAKTEYLTQPQNFDSIIKYANALCSYLDYSDSQELQAEAEKMLTLFYKMYPNDTGLTLTYASMLSDAALNKENGYKYVEILKRLHMGKNDMRITAIYVDTLSDYSSIKDSNIKFVVAELLSIWKQHREVEEIAESFAYSLGALALTQSHTERSATQNALKRLAMLYPKNEAITEVYEEEMSCDPLEFMCDLFDCDGTTL